NQIRHPLAGSGFVVPRVEPDVRIMAASWVTSKWPGRAPAVRVLLRAFIGGMRSPDWLERDDAELAGVARTDLARLLGIDGEPTLTRVHRWPSANAQHEVGHLDRLAALEAP